MKQLLERISTSLGADDRSKESAALPSRANRMWSEQPDLWSVGSAKPEPASAEPRARPPTFDFSATEIVRSRPKTPKALQTTTTAVAYAEQRRGLNAQNIARFLEVNRTVQSPRGFVYRVIQAARGVSADYDLWKGPTRRVTFLLG